MHASAPGAKDSMSLAAVDALVVVLLATACCWPVVFGDRTFYAGDTWLHYLPAREFATGEWAAGRAPWWDPRLHGGVPFLLNTSNLAVHPTTLAYFAMSLERAFGVATALSLGVAGVGAWWLARQIGLGRAPAIVSGLITATCGVTVSLVGLHPHLVAFTMIPMIVAAWSAWLSGGTRRWLALVAV